MSVSLAIRGIDDIAVTGDSSGEAKFIPEGYGFVNLIAEYLRAPVAQGGYNLSVDAVNYCLSGDCSEASNSGASLAFPQATGSTPGTLNRCLRMTGEIFGNQVARVPKICGFSIGTNDTANYLPNSASLVSTKTTENIKTSIRAIRNGCYSGYYTGLWVNGIVDNPSLLPANMPVGAKFLVRNDNNATYGDGISHNILGASISTSAGDGNRCVLASGAQTNEVWVCVNGYSGILGWCRTYSEERLVAASVAFTPKVKYFFVVGIYIYQSESGGPNAGLQAVRARQQAAVTDLIALGAPYTTGGNNIIYVDTYTPAALMVTDGVPITAFSYFPGASGGADNHQGILGNAVIAKNVVAGMESAGWITRTATSSRSLMFQQLTG